MKLTNNNANKQNVLEKKGSSVNRRQFLIGAARASSSIAGAPASLEKAVSKKLPLHVYDDDAYPTYFRRPLTLDAPRVRYPGFNPGSEILRKGTIRRVGAMPLPCDILLECDIALTLRDGTVIYTDVFCPVADGEYPAILARGPYDKQIGGQ